MFVVTVAKYKLTIYTLILQLILFKHLHFDFCSLLGTVT